MEKTKGIIGLGNPLIDIAMNVDENKLKELNLEKGRFIELNADKIFDYVKNYNHKIFHGDSTANTIFTSALNSILNKSNFNMAYIGKIGNDKNGIIYTEELNKVGVKTFMIKGEKPTGVCLAAITPDSERSFAADLGSSITLTKQDIIDNGLISEIKKYDIFHITAYQLTNSRMREAILYIIENVKDEIIISFDLADPNVVKSIKDKINNILNSVNILFANKEEAIEFFNEESNAKCLAEKFNEFVDIAIVKDGINGSFIYADELYEIKPYPVNAIDTTGAGDTYAGTFLFYYLNGNSIIEAGDKASRISSFIVRKLGGRLDKITSEMFLEK